MSVNSNKTIAFNYFGGKFTWVEHIYANFPPPNKFVHLVDLFAGSMVVSLNYRGRVIRTANEINGEITNFFTQLRDSWIFEGEHLTDLERARRFYVRVRQSFFGLGAQRQNKGWHMAKQHVNAQGGESVSRWKNGVEKLHAVAAEIRDNFQIVNTDYMTAINRIDNTGAFFYCDPPYPLECRNSKNDYLFEFTDEQHRQLADRLHRIEGLAMVSGYDCPLMNELYGNWRKVKFPFKRNNIRSNIKNGSGTIMQECIWMNYEPTIQTQKLF